MSDKTRKFAVLAGLFLLALTVTVAQLAQPAQAAREAVPLFHDELARHGRWVDMDRYGPVWYPTGVGARWRPYLNGRWTPIHEGWVFETGEPWGWATYHYGNWFPTVEFGWVWVPGSTWYPSTCAWRTSDDYCGWAPIPPPEYVPEPAFYPEGGYVPGTPVLELVTAPFWVFVGAANFVLGFGQPFVPTYTYVSCGCLTPFSYVPTIYAGTFLLTDFYYPAYAPAAFYCFGPPFPFVARVTNINIERINVYVNQINIIKVRNVLPPRRLLETRPFLRDAVPAAVREGKRFEVRRVSDVARAERELAHPTAVKPPANLPPVKGKIAKAPPLKAPEKVSPKPTEKMKGMGLPPKAEKRVTPQGKKEMGARPKMEQPARMETKPEFRRHPPEAKPAAPAEVKPHEAKPPAEVKPHEAKPPAEVKPHEAKPAPPAEVKPHEARPAPPVHEMRPAAPAPERHPSMPREFHPAPRPEVSPAPHAAPPPSGGAPAAAPARPAPEPRPQPGPKEQAPPPR